MSHARGTHTTPPPTDSSMNSGMDRTRTISPLRVVVATAGLVATGIVVGGLCGALALAAAAVLTGNWRVILDHQIWLFGGAVGAAVGAVVAPLMSWLFLRHVPLGRAIVETAVGSVLGGVIAFALPFNPIAGAVLGFTAAAVRLFVVDRRARRRLRR